MKRSTILNKTWLQLNKLQKKQTLELMIDNGLIKSLHEKCIVHTYKDGRIKGYTYHVPFELQNPPLNN